ncbi:hypothetical protein NQZ68_030165 [Dissostichus eleginoides]|nr:hypothetical protein NQZ68_030165 [Dissostichus eleginoides]
MENSPVGMAGLREGSWIVLGVWQRGAQSENSGTGTTRIAEHDGLSSKSRSARGSFPARSFGPSEDSASA